MTTSIDWRDVKVGQQYKYEEKYYIQADVTVLDDIPTPDDNYKKFKIRVDKAYLGCNEGDELTVGRKKEVTRTEWAYVE